MSYKWHHNFPKIAREAGFTIHELSIGHCIDWRFIASIDPYGIVSDQDYEKLDEFIPHISEVPIGNVLNNRILDPAIGKYFVLAQFSIQYLLFCKQFLDETVVEIRNGYQSMQDENVRLEKMNKKRNEDMALLQKKLQRAEHMDHQRSQQATAVYPCSKCTKNFISPELLNAHMIRKHVTSSRSTDGASERKPPTTDTNLINTIKLELEVKQLKERLNAAEKDLRSKHHRCRVCSEDSSSSTIDKPPTKVLHSIGIQSNLTDDKDSNDKEAETQTEILPIVHSTVATAAVRPTERSHTPDHVSKSDLKSFLDEQKLLFENWKAGERRTLNQEIETVKQNLVDVIQIMEKSERNTPVPVLDESVWKDRYHELEKMYETSQKQARDAISSFEASYSQKMAQLEKLLLETRELEHREPTIVTTTVNSKHSVPYNPALFKMVTLPTIVIEGDLTKNDTNFIYGTHEHEPSRTNSSESEHSESDEELRKLETMQERRQSVTTIVPAETVQETLEKTRPQSHSSQKTLLVSPKKQILSQFRARLKAIGVDPKSKTLLGENLNSACKALADQREVQKQKHNNFFITRNQLLSKVDQLAKMKVGETPPSKPPHIAKKSEDHPILMSRQDKPSGKGPSTKPRLKTSSALQLLPSKHKLNLPDTVTAHSSAVNVFKSKSSLVSSTLTAYNPTIKLTDDDIITVHADVSQPAGQEKRASISSYDQQVERLLHTPIKTINPVIVMSKPQSQPRGSMMEEITAVSTGILEAEPLHPKPIPKKRVLFNLDKTEHANTAGPSTVGSQQQVVNEYSRTQHTPIVQRTKVDEESDWNISSFDEDK